MMMCRIVLPSFLRLRLKSVRPPPRMYTSFINLILTNLAALSSRAARRRLGGACAPQSSAKSIQPGDVATNRQRVDILRAFVCINTLEVHHVPDHRVAI